uniref:NR LBD domain-containing protein n=1 Tax=Bursaphelenchus xylophilus TaxID=6326 RepID=A0A1I7SP60_BURXY
MELPQAGLNVLYEYLPLPEMPLLETLTVGFKCIETSPPPSTKLYTQIMEGLKVAAPNLKDLALRYRLLIDSRKISKHLQQLELVMSKVKYLAEGIQLSKINSSGIVMDFEFSTVIEVSLILK